MSRLPRPGPARSLSPPIGPRASAALAIVKRSPSVSPVRARSSILPMLDSTTLVAMGTAAGWALETSDAAYLTYRKFPVPNPVPYPATQRSMGPLDREEYEDQWAHTYHGYMSCFLPGYADDVRGKCLPHYTFPLASDICPEVLDFETGRSLLLQVFNKAAAFEVMGKMTDEYIRRRRGRGSSPGRESSRSQSPQRRGRSRERWQERPAGKAEQLSPPPPQRRERSCERSQERPAAKAEQLPTPLKREGRVVVKREQQQSPLGCLLQYEDVFTVPALMLNQREKDVAKRAKYIMRCDKERREARKQRSEECAAEEHAATQRAVEQRPEGQQRGWDVGHSGDAGGPDLGQVRKPMGVFKPPPPRALHHEQSAGRQQSAKQNLGGRRKPHRGGRGSALRRQQQRADARQQQQDHDNGARGHRSDGTEDEQVGRKRRGSYQDFSDDERRP